MKMTLEEKTRALLESIGGRLEPAGQRHIYDAAIEHRPKPRWVVQAAKPRHDLATFRSLGDAWAWAEKEAKKWKDLNQHTAEALLRGRPRIY